MVKYRKISGLEIKRGKFRILRKTKGNLKKLQFLGNARWCGLLTSPAASGGENPSFGIYARLFHRIKGSRQPEFGTGSFDILDKWGKL
jgi:hypothetical protein